MRRPKLPCGEGLFLALQAAAVRLLELSEGFLFRVLGFEGFYKVHRKDFYEGHCGFRV